MKQNTVGQRKISNWTFLWKYDISKEGLIWFAAQSEMLSGLYHIVYIIYTILKYSHIFQTLKVQ